MSRYLLLLVNAVVLLLMVLSPWAIPMREFDGTGYLLSPLGSINPKGLTLPDGLSFGWLGLALGVWVVLVGLASAALFLPDAKQRARLLYAVGGVGIAVFLLEALLFYTAINSTNSAALAAGASRVPLRRFTLSLGMYMGLFYSIGVLILGRMQLAGGRAFFVRYRGVVVPVVALLLGIIIGALVLAVLRPGLGVEEANVGLRETIAAKLDLVTYAYQLLFSPILTLAGVFNSLSFATPLIFTGVAVALGFRAGLFNIGAPGQIIIGAIFAMLVGVYVPGPTLLILPLTILAAALGGALWGAIPGWLKARFGANEVINTIMMNYIANSVLLFTITSNEHKFFGQTVHLPFKAEGYEARSHELQAAAQLPRLHDIFAPKGEFSWAVPLAVIAAVAVYYGLRNLDLGRRVLYATLAIAGGALVGGFLPGFEFNFGSNVRSTFVNGSFLVALLALLFYNFYLFRTAAGYELRATGLAPKAAEYAGVNLNRATVLAMALSGAMAGLAAIHYVMGGGVNGEPRLQQIIPADVGFFGIAVALMGQNTPIGVLLSSLLFGVLTAGSTALSSIGITNQVLQVLQALIILFIAVGGLLPRYFTDPLRAAQVETEARDQQEKQAAQGKAVGG